MLEAAEIAELAWSGLSRRMFRDEIVRRLQEHVGYDGGWFHTLDPALPLDTGCWHALDLRWIERARSGWSEYAPRLLRLREAMGAQRGVAQDSEVWRPKERERIPFFVDVVRPLGMEHMLWTQLSLGGEELSVIGLARADRSRPFGQRNQELLRRLAPTLALAEGVLALRAPPPPECLSVLAPRERQIVDLLTLGYTNSEIARALGTSTNTVRNQMSGLIRKLGATNRSEVVGLALGRIAPLR